MMHARLDEMINGWFVGAFDPSVLKTNFCEIAVKYYCAGDKEALHHHRSAKEITVVVTVWLKCWVPFGGRGILL